jgi:hypothetical protein
MVIEQLSQEPSKMQKLSSLIKLKFFITDWFQAIEASVLWNKTGTGECQTTEFQKKNPLTNMAYNSMDQVVTDMT